MENANSECAATAFAHPRGSEPWGAWVGSVQQNRALWPQIKPIRAGFVVNGVAGVPGYGCTKKKRVFRFLFFWKFPPQFIYKKSPIESLSNYIYIYIPNAYLIYGEGSPGYFFGGAPTGRRARQVGKAVPTVAAHPGVFFDGAQRSQAPGMPGDARGMRFPRLLHPGAHPIIL